MVVPMVVQLVFWMDGSLVAWMAAMMAGLTVGNEVGSMAAIQVGRKVAKLVQRQGRMMVAETVRKMVYVTAVWMVAWSDGSTVALWVAGTVVCLVDQLGLTKAVEKAGHWVA